ncbi:PPC domain-containing protein [Schlesneria sp. DSM 10557]|uniref:PPC domain-containing protein n=1 Tax=Schlesneria sp. DSM 10557 TaxID=3044399 RepID=UPI0035A0625A
MRIMLTTAFLVGLLNITHAAGPSVESVIPAIGQRDTSFTLRLVGAGLSKASELMLYSPDVVCTELKPVTDNELLATLKTTHDCRPGTYAFRVRSPQGVSELRIFRITPFPVVNADEPNESLEEAMSLDRNVTVTGLLEKGDRDYFKLRLRRGDRLSAEVEAVRLGATMIDTVLTVLDAEGKELASADDTPLFGQDPYVSVIVPEDGDYFVRVQEVNLDGDDSGYALHVGTFPRPSSVFPAGGRIGESLTVRFLGDAAGPFEQKVQLPASPDNTHGLFASHLDTTSPTAIPFRISPFENVLEVEPNDAAGTSSNPAIDLPVAFNGVLSQIDDIDLFRFRVNAGQRFQFEAFASRLGSPADTVISILDLDGSILVSNDDDGSHDSRLVFQAPRTGEYLLRVVDQRGAGGEHFFYRVEATPTLPVLTAFMPRPNRLSQDRQAISVPQGNRIVTFLGVNRKGVTSKVQLTPQGLPLGIKNFPTTIDSDRFQVPVVIEAEADAPIAGALVQLNATGSANQSTVTGTFQQVVDLINMSADRLYQSVSVDRLMIAVVEPVPFRIELEPLKSPLVQDGFVELNIHVHRDPGFNDAIDITFPFLPPWVDGPPLITVPANKTVGTYLAHAHPQVEPRKWTICAEGRVSTGVSRGPVSDDIEMAPAPRSRGRRAQIDTAVSSQLIDLDITRSPVSGTIGRVAGEQGTTLLVTCSIERNGELPHRLIATLEGLPNRVHVEPVQVDSQAKQVTFSVKLDPTAPVGEFDSLVCRLTGTRDGQSASFNLGRGGLLKIVPPGGLVTDAEGRPLSPLEALRKTQTEADPENTVGGNKASSR